MTETIICPYCESKVKMADVDADHGTCPECGAPLLGSVLFPPAGEEDFDTGDEAFAKPEKSGNDFLDTESDDANDDDFFGKGHER